MSFSKKDNLYILNGREFPISAILDEVQRIDDEERGKFLLDESVEFDERVRKLKVYNTALHANKNIVSASVVQVHIENFKL